LSPTKMIDSAVTLKFHNSTTLLGITEQLYTAAGSQATMLHFSNNHLDRLSSPDKNPLLQK